MSVLEGSSRSASLDLSRRLCLFVFVGLPLLSRPADRRSSSTEILDGGGIVVVPFATSDFLLLLAQSMSCADEKEKYNKIWNVHFSSKKISQHPLQASDPRHNFAVD
jgi:hypothetical protein